MISFSFLGELNMKITEKYIKKLQLELTNEQYQRVLYYLTDNHLMELKELARRKVIDKFVRVMRRYNSNYIKKLIKNNKIKKETINLLKQSNMSLKNVHKLIKSKSIVDANVILRSSFENLIMGMMISSDENVYNEFIDLSINDETRKYTKPQFLRNHFRTILKEIDSEMFTNFSNINLKRMLDEFYDKLCLYTHSTLIVNAMVELKDDDSLDLYIFALKQNAYFIEIILYLCLKFLNNSKKEPIDITYIVVGWFIMLCDIDKDKISIEHLNKIKKILFFELNEKYFDKSKNSIELLNKELLDMQHEIEVNIEFVFNILIEITK